MNAKGSGNGCLCGVPASAIILSHFDKPHDSNYLIELAETGAVLELDQGLREFDKDI